MSFDVIAFGEPRHWRFPYSVGSNRLPSMPGAQTSPLEKADSVVASADGVLVRYDKSLGSRGSAAVVLRAGSGAYEVWHEDGSISDATPQLVEDLGLPPNPPAAPTYRWLRSAGATTPWNTSIADAEDLALYKAHRDEQDGPVASLRAARKLLRR